MGACTISPLRNMQHIARVTPRSHSCKDDINNQAILDLAREVDKDSRRTLGVLTKPDTIGEPEFWAAMSDSTDCGGSILCLLVPRANRVLHHACAAGVLRTQSAPKHLMCLQSLARTTSGCRC